MPQLPNTGGEGFSRVRIGIGRPGENGDVIDHVLSPFSDDELNPISTAVDRAAVAVEYLVAHGETETMNNFNVRVPSEDDFN